VRDGCHKSTYIALVFSTPNDKAEEQRKTGLHQEMSRAYQCRKDDVISQLDCCELYPHSATIERSFIVTTPAVALPK